MVHYHEHFIRPLLELSLAHRKRVMLQNKNVWWAYWPAEARLRELIFNGRYRSVLLPCVEDSNSRSPEVNLAARVGLWLDEQVADWASRSIADQFSFNRSWEWEYVMTGHPVLRYNVAQAMLGARTFMLLNGERERVSGRWTRVGTEGTATFLHLLGRGAITPPRREQLAGLSPVALAMQQPSRRFIVHGANGHSDSGWGRDPTDARPWAFDRLDCYWGMAPLPPTDVATYLWGRTRRDAAQLPTTTPHGFVALLPGGISRSSPRWKTTWTTDGDTLRKGGPRLCTAGGARGDPGRPGGGGEGPAVSRRGPRVPPDHRVLARAIPRCAHRPGLARALRAHGAVVDPSARRMDGRGPHHGRDARRIEWRAAGVRARRRPAFARCATALNPRFTP
jgi:hypothetical protein